MYQDSLLKKPEALKHLKDLGYDNADANAMLALADVKSKSSTLKALQRGVEASLKAHHLTEQQALNELTAAGMDHQQASQLIDLWLTERGKPTRSLTEAQILKLGSEGLISPDDTKARLISAGLVEQDAQLLMRLHGIIK